MKVNITANFLVYSLFIMLALGNVGVNVDYLGAIPFGLIIAWLTKKNPAEVDA